jgi:hypothetical protein
MLHEIEIALNLFQNLTKGFENFKTELKKTKRANIE